MKRKSELLQKPMEYAQILEFFNYPTDKSFRFSFSHFMDSQIKLVNTFPEIRNLTDSERFVVFKAAYLKYGEVYKSTLKTKNHSSERMQEVCNDAYNACYADIMTYLQVGSAACVVAGGLTSLGLFVVVGPLSAGAGFVAAGACLAVVDYHSSRQQTVCQNDLMACVRAQGSNGNSSSGNFTGQLTIGGIPTGIWYTIYSETFWPDVPPANPQADCSQGDTCIPGYN